MKYLRRPIRDFERSDHDAIMGLVTASKARAPKLMNPMMVKIPMSAPSKMKGGKIRSAPGASGGM